MTMIARIAEVLRKARVDGGWDDEAVAVKVLREMREPDATMCDAANEWVCNSGEPPAETNHIWRAMIDAALDAAEPAHSSSEIGHG